MLTSDGLQERRLSGAEMSETRRQSGFFFFFFFLFVLISGRRQCFVGGSVFETRLGTLLCVLRTGGRRYERSPAAAAAEANSNLSFLGKNVVGYEAGVGRVLAEQLLDLVVIAVAGSFGARRRERAAE